MIGTADTNGHDIPVAVQESSKADGRELYGKRVHDLSPRGYGIVFA